MYFLFAGDNYYPVGGMEDLVGTFSTIDEARVEAEAGETIYAEYVRKYDWWHIATIRNGQLVVVA
jgi:hypothetical protein